MRFGLFYHKNFRAQRCAEEVEDSLTEAGHQVLMNQIDPEMDIAITFGGDGLVLHVANDLAEKGLSVPMVRVNFGDVGFLTNVEPDEIFSRLPDIISNGYILVARSRMSASVRRQKKEVILVDALNDIVIERTGTKPVSFEIKNIGLNELIFFKGDGTIFATMTGSTAYNDKAMGPVLTKDNFMAVAFVCPSVRMINRLFRFDRLTKFVARNFSDNHPRIVADGNEVIQLLKKDVVIIVKSKKSTIFLEFVNK